MKETEVKDAFDNITVWKRRGERAPHKPLLVLYALARCWRGETGLIPYAEIDRDLRKLLLDFGPTRKSYHPEYPFWRLQNDRIWELKGAEAAEARKGHTDAKRSELLKYNVQGGFTEAIQKYLLSDRKLIAEIASDLLDANFPDTLHEGILQAFGLDLDARDHSGEKRDPHFRERVLRAYEYRCAVCGFDVRLGDSLIGLEAAHIKWSQAGGPHTEPNGVALCSLHHKLFDRGVFTITESLQLIVSERAHGSAGFEEWLMGFHGKLIRGPQRPAYNPEKEFIAWHAREVFKNPSRYIQAKEVP